jgi:hypothetical protein
MTVQSNGEMTRRVSGTFYTGQSRTKQQKDLEVDLALMDMLCMLFGDI